MVGMLGVLVGRVGMLGSTALVPGSAASVPQHHPSVISEPLQCQGKEGEHGTEWRGRSTLVPCGLNHARSPWQTSAPTEQHSWDLRGEMLP